MKVLEQVSIETTTENIVSWKWEKLFYNKLLHPNDLVLNSQFSFALIQLFDLYNLHEMSFLLLWNK